MHEAEAITDWRPRAREHNQRGATILCPYCKAIQPDEASICRQCGSPIELNLPPKTSWKAVTSLMLGIFFWAFPFAIASIVLGHMSLKDIRNSGGKLAGRGIAMGGLVLGYVGIAVLPMILAVRFWILPKLMASPAEVNESSAITALGTIRQAAESYQRIYGNGYPPQLSVLTGLGAPDCNQAGLIDGALASGQRFGYDFTYTVQNARLTAGKGCLAPGGDGYSVTANPSERGTTGQRSFFLDEAGVIHVETGTTATKTSPPLQ